MCHRGMPPGGNGTESQENGKSRPSFDFISHSMQTLLLPHVKNCLFIGSFFYTLPVLISEIITFVFHYTGDEETKKLYQE